jgi:hypothetical protein
LTVATKIVYDDGATPAGKVSASTLVKPKSAFAPTLLRYVPWIVAALAVLVAVSVVLVPHEAVGPSPAPSSSAVHLGQTFAPKLANSLADGFDANADAAEAGKSFGDADEALKDAFFRSRQAAFDQHASDAIHAIVADGKDSKDPEVRQRWVQFHRDFAKGLRRAK